MEERSCINIAEYQEDEKEEEKEREEKEKEMNTSSKLRSDCLKLPAHVRYFKHIIKSRHFTVQHSEQNVQRQILCNVRDHRMHLHVLHVLMHENHFCIVWCRIQNTLILVNPSEKYKSSR